MGAFLNTSAHSTNVAAPRLLMTLRALHTGKPRDVKVQAHKITAFCNWSHMSVNGTKCGVTGIRHGMDGRTQSNPLSRSSIAALRNSLQDVHVQQQPIPFHHPDKDPYPYLGVLMTITLNFTHYYLALLAKLKEKTEQLNKSFATGPQRLRALTQCIIPGATYAFPLLPIGPTELNRCDAIIAKCAKQAVRLPLWVASRAVHASRAEGGLGIPSLHTPHAPTMHLDRYQGLERTKAPWA